MLESDSRRRLSVGVFAVALLGLLAVATLMLGKKQGLFISHHRYLARFEHVGGLVPGAPVWLNGVVVGSVDEVTLPGDPSQREITVSFTVDSRLALRIRADSRVRIRTLGLLGDRYLEVSSGSPEEPVIKPGGEIPSEEPTDVAAVLSQGGDVVTNVLAISSSLRTILERVERGEGVLGELTTNPQSGHEAVQKLVSLLTQTDELLRNVRAGKGLLGRLVADPQLATRLVDDLQGLAHAGRQVAESLQKDLSRNDSLLAGLLRDPQGRQRLQTTLDQMGEAAAAAAAASKELVEGRGTLPRLLGDQKYASDFLDNLAGLTQSLRNVADKLDKGQGSAGLFVNDPQLWKDIENVVRGVKESHLLRWYIRNRRRAGEREAAKATPVAHE
jgi:phospholipid/cholesterol/gamma-HCH transport system substrate-binding protein